MATTRRASTRAAGKRSGSKRTASTSRSKSARSAGGASTSGSRSARRPAKSGLFAKVLIGLLILLVVGGIGFAILWPGIQREQALTAIETASSPAEEDLAIDAFLQLIAEDPDRDSHVGVAISTRRGSLRAQIELSARAKLVDKLIVIANRPITEVDDDTRARALQRAVVLLQENGKSSQAHNIIDSRLREWLLQPARGEPENAEPHRDLAVAAANLIGAGDLELDGDDPAKVLSVLAYKPDLDPILLDTVIDNLAAVTDRQNVGYAIGLLNTPNADKVLAHRRLEAVPTVIERSTPGLLSGAGVEAKAEAIARAEGASYRHDSLLTRMTQSVQPSNLDRILELLESDDARLQAVALALLKGGGLATIAPEQREDVGRRIAAYLQPAVRNEKPAVFAEALRSAAHLRLLGARRALLDLLPLIPAGDPDAIVLARALGKDLPSNEENDRQAVEELLQGLAKAIDGPAGRDSAIAAARQLQVRGPLHLRTLLEALVAVGGQSPAAIAAAKHIVKELFQESQIAERLGDDPQAWTAFLKEDRPRFDKVVEVRTWLIDNQDHHRANTEQDILKKNHQLGIQYTEEMKKWPAPPLGMQQRDLEMLIKQADALKFDSYKSQR